MNRSNSKQNRKYDKQHAVKARYTQTYTTTMKIEHRKPKRQ